MTKYNIGDIFCHNRAEAGIKDYYLVEHINIIKGDGIMSSYEVRNLLNGSTRKFYCDIVDERKDIKAVA